MGKNNLGNVWQYQIEQLYLYCRICGGIGYTQFVSE
jgi:hypothetical protein